MSKPSPVEGPKNRFWKWHDELSPRTRLFFWSGAAGISGALALIALLSDSGTHAILYRAF